jgi:predicted Na+-dependent transporter
VIIPFLVALSIYNYLIHNYVKYLDRVPAMIMLYVLFVAPFLYFIPYRFTKPKSKFSFIFWGVVIPYLLIYLSTYLFFRAAFRGFGGGIG